MKMPKESNQLVRKNSKKLIYFAIFCTIVTGYVFWNLSSINSKPIPNLSINKPKANFLTEEQLAIILEQEKHVIDKYNKKDLETFEKVKKSIIEDLNALFENIKVRKKADDDLREIIAANSNLPSNYIKRLSFTKARAGVAVNPATPSQILDRLSLDINANVRANVAKNLSTPPSVLIRLSEDIEDDVKINVAKNHNTPKHVLRELTKEDDSKINIALAGNHNTPKNILNQFLRGEGAGILDGCDLLSAAYSNPIIDLDFLYDYMNDDNWCVRRGVAMNHSSNSSILNTLARDEEKLVREAIAKNQNTPPETLNYIIMNEKDGWLPTPRDYAFSNPNIGKAQLIDYYDKDDNDIKGYISSNPSSPENVLKVLYHRENQNIHSKIACNPSCPPKLLNRFAENESTREMVAKNPNCQPGLLISLLQSPDNDAGIDGFVDEISGFLGINPTFIMKWAKGSSDGEKNKELEDYILMLFADNIVSPEEFSDEIEKIYLTNVNMLKKDLKANLNEMLFTISQDLTTNTELLNIRIALDDESFRKYFQLPLEEISSDLVKTSENLALLASSFLMYDLIILVQQRATVAFTKAGQTLSKSGGGSNWQTWAILAVQIAFEIAAEQYAESELREKIGSELDTIKANIINGTGNKYGLVDGMKMGVNSYLDSKNDIFLKALKESIQVNN